jgi:hypothetical protein
MRFFSATFATFCVAFFSKTDTFSQPQGRQITPQDINFWRHHCIFFEKEAYF